MGYHIIHDLPAFSYYYICIEQKEWKMLTGRNKNELFVILMAFI